jgi:osmotically-inducible protein OsmY
VALALTATGEVAAQQPPDKEPDNTGINQRDRQPDAVTADKQKGNPDADITRQIRQAIVKEKAVSHYAHNVKVVTQDGVVTLRGPVRSEQEKDAVQAIAVRVAGESNVKNELEVVPPQKGSN